MKQNLTEFVRKCQFPLILVFASAPIPLEICAYISNDLIPFAWLFLAAYFALSAISLLIPGKLRLSYGILGFLLLCGLAALPALQVRAYSLMCIPVVYGILLIWGLQIAKWSWDTEIHSFWIWTGIVVHLIAQVMLLAARVNEITSLEPVTPSINLCFFLFAALGMLSLNRSNLSDASMGKQRASGKLRRFNVVFTLIFFVIALLVTLIPAVVAAVRKAWNWLIDVISQAATWIIAHYPTGSSSSDSSDSPEGLDMGGFETSDFALLLEKIVMFLFKLVMLAMLALAAYFLLRQIIKLLRKLWVKLMNYTSNISEDYEDIITDTREEGEKEGLFSKKIRERFITVDERTLSPDARIRRRYWKLMKKHPEWAAGTTAREKLPPDIAPLYEQARYSEHPITEADAEKFTTGIKRV